MKFAFIAKHRGIWPSDWLCVCLPRDASFSDLRAVCSIVQQIKSLGLKAGVFGLTSGDEVMELATAGCAFLGGRIFGGPFKELPKPYAMPISSVEEPKRNSRLSNFFRR